MITTCTCTHKDQDRLHGKNQRVFTPFGKADKKAYRCTVCRSVKHVKSS